MQSTLTNWNYHERKDKHGGVITSWIKESHLSVKAKARLERALDQLRKMPKTEWHKPNPASNIGDHTYVIRFKDVTGAQMRVFGHFFDPHSSFVMTFEGGEKDNVYKPTNYQDLAQHHRKECNQSFQSKTIPYDQRCSLCTPPKKK